MSEERSDRGRRAANRGKAYEREVSRRLGVPRTGHFGGKADVGDGSSWIVAQVKVGVAYPERLDRWLRAIPANETQLRALVVADAPGPGHHRRELLIVDLDDFVAWFGDGR